MPKKFGAYSRLASRIEVEIQMTVVDAIQFATQGAHVREELQLRFEGHPQRMKFNEGKFDELGLSFTVLTQFAALRSRSENLL